MILVMLGTSPYPFSRLMLAVDMWARNSNEKVIAQTGHTPTEGIQVECHAFVDHSQIIKWLEEAELVICQGGFGSLKDCFTAGKPTIAVPRRTDLFETKAEQSELVHALASEGRVVALENMENLSDMIEIARNMKFGKNLVSKIPRLVAEKIHSVMGRV